MEAPTPYIATKAWAEVWYMTIEGELLGLNEYIALERSNRFKAAKAKKEYTAICYYSAVEALRKSERNPNPAALYDVSVMWTVDNNRHDPDNIYFGIKFILDGLVTAGVIKADTRKHIRRVQHNIMTANKCKIEVALYAVKHK